MLLKHAMGLDHNLKYFMIIKFLNVSIFSVNKVRIRDTIGEDLNLFEVHKLEDMGMAGLEHRTSDASDDTEGDVVIMRIECQSEGEKNSWVRSINTEIKQLRTMVKTLSSQFLLLS